jgi:hypothetical protein
MKKDNITNKFKFCNDYNDEFPFKINGNDLQGNPYLTKCDICKQDVIAYYEFRVNEPICPECFWRMAKEIKKA